MTTIHPTPGVADFENNPDAAKAACIAIAQQLANDATTTAEIAKQIAAEFLQAAIPTAAALVSASPAGPAAGAAIAGALALLQQGLSAPNALSPEQQAFVGQTSQAVVAAVAAKLAAKKVP